MQIWQLPALNYLLSTRRMDKLHKSARDTWIRGHRRERKRGAAKHQSTKWLVQWLWFCAQGGDHPPYWEAVVAEEEEKYSCVVWWSELHKPSSCVGKHSGVSAIHDECVYVLERKRANMWNCLSSRVRVCVHMCVVYLFSRLLVYRLLLLRLLSCMDRNVPIVASRRCSAYIYIFKYIYAVRMCVDLYARLLLLL